MSKGGIIAALVVVALCSWIAVMYWRYENDPQTIRENERQRMAAAAQDDADRYVERARRVVTLSLKDPDSAKFENVRYVGRFDMKTGKHADASSEMPIYVVCGWVNAKNSFGGYTGFKPFGVYDGGSSVTMGDETASRLKTTKQFMPYFNDCWLGWEPRGD